MTGGQLANGIGSGIAGAFSATFVVTYTILAKWHKSAIGRFMILMAAGVFFTCFITLNITSKGFSPSADWLRYIQAGLWVIIGATYAFHSWQVWKAQREGNK